MGAEEKFDRRNLAEKGQRFKQHRKHDADGCQYGDGRTGNEHEFDKRLKPVAGAEFPGDERMAGGNGSRAEKRPPPQA